MNSDVKYSSLLQDFAQPLIDGEETPDEVMQKLKVAESSTTTFLRTM